MKKKNNIQPMNFTFTQTINKIGENKFSFIHANMQSTSCFRMCLRRTGHETRGKKFPNAESTRVNPVEQWRRYQESTMQQDQTVTRVNEREGPEEGAFKKKGTQYNVQHDEAFGNH